MLVATEYYKGVDKGRLEGIPVFVIHPFIG